MGTTARKRDDESAGPRKMSININKNSISICSLPIRFGSFLLPSHSAGKDAIRLCLKEAKPFGCPWPNCATETRTHIRALLKALACFGLTFKLVLHSSIADTVWGIYIN